MSPTRTEGEWLRVPVLLWWLQDNHAGDLEEGSVSVATHPCNNHYQRTRPRDTADQREGGERNEWQVTRKSGLIQGWISWLKARIRWENTRWMIKIQGNSSICVCVVSDTRTALLWINQLDCRLSLVWVNNMNTGGLFTCFCELNLPTDW